MNIAIVDDSVEYAKILEKEIRKYYPNAIVEIYNQMVEQITGQQYDLIFLDVLFAQETSFEYGKKLTENNIVVYISSIDNFIFESVKQNSFYFVRKSNLSEDIKNLINKYEENKLHKTKKLKIICNRQEVVIFTDDIIIIQSHGHCITVQTTYGNFETRMTLNTIKKMLDEQFYQLNRSYILNMKKIKNVNKEIIEMENEVIVYQSRHSYLPLMEEYGRFKRRQLWIG